MKAGLGTFTMAVCAFALVTATPSRALAQGHDHGQAQQQNLTPDQRKGQNQLVEIVRDFTRQFQNPADAEDAGYKLMFGCVTGPDFGAMGMHFVKGALLDEKIDPYEPEIILYEPLPNGRLRLLGADYLVDKAAWDAKNPGGAPVIFGQIFQLIDKPNRFGLEPFYTLHVWAWKDNPAGTFTNWHANVRCDGFNGEPK